jgi:hypothetical protein
MKEAEALWETKLILLLVNQTTIASNTVGMINAITGNPYPSAIDADAFINNNIGAIESFSSPSRWNTLQEHYATNTPYTS